jgi:hypothetical protein
VTTRARLGYADKRAATGEDRRKCNDTAVPESAERYAASLREVPRLDEVACLLLLPQVRRWRHPTWGLRLTRVL